MQFVVAHSPLEMKLVIGVLQSTQVDEQFVSCPASDGRQYAGSLLGRSSVLSRSPSQHPPWSGLSRSLPSPVHGAAVGFKRAQVRNPPQVNFSEQSNAKHGHGEGSFVQPALFLLKL